MGDVSTNPKKSNRQKENDAICERTRILAMQYQCSFRQCSINHYRLEHGKEWGLNLYPTTGKIIQDDGRPRRCKIPKLPRSWTIEDVVKAVIKSEGLQRGSFPGIPYPETQRPYLSAKGLVEEIEAVGPLNHATTFPIIGAGLFKIDAGYGALALVRAGGKADAAIAELEKGLAELKRFKTFRQPREVDAPAAALDPGLSRAKVNPPVYRKTTRRFGFLWRRKETITDYICTPGETALLTNFRHWPIYAIGPCSLRITETDGTLELQVVGFQNSAF